MGVFILVPMFNKFKINLLPKLLITLGITGYAFANDNQLFQNMDNQIAVGIGYSSLNAYNPGFQSIQETITDTSLNIHVEQLFNSNVWLAVDGNLIVNANENGSNGFGFLGGTQAFGLPGGLTGKAGYSFNWADLGLQVIPYATTGAVLNYNGVTFPYSGFGNSYYVLYGGGIRAEYVILPELSVFFDQMVGYLNDQGTYRVNLSAMTYNSTLGIRYNVTDSFQLGLQGSINQINTTNNIGSDNVALIYRNTNQTTYGGMLSFAYLYNNKGALGSSGLSNYNDAQLAHFDNSYGVGYGFLRSTNSYSGGKLPTINSNLNTLNVEFSHLFENNLWAQVNGSLITGINQANLPAGTAQSVTPAYSGFPGDLEFNLGYALTFPREHMQLIPYVNGGIEANINAYNVTQSSSLAYILSHDLYVQYGAGARFEYAPTKIWLVYLDQLFAGLDDRSSNNVNAWRSTTSLGTKLNITQNVMLGVNGFYDIITPTGTTYNPGAGVNYALQQNTYGGILSIGVNY